MILILIAPLVAAGVVQSLCIRYKLLPRLALPIDANLMLHRRPLFGPNKTWRGLLVMTVVSSLAAAMILPLHPPVEPPPTLGWAGLGAIMGGAYVLAELPNSFLKRRLGIHAGASVERYRWVQYGLDQADSAVGVAIVVTVVLEGDIGDFVALSLVGTAAHAVFDTALRVSGVKQRIKSE